MQIQPIKDFFVSSFMPQQHFMTLLERSGISSPSKQLFKRTFALPYMQIEGLAKRVLGTPINATPIAIIKATQQGQKSINLREMFGCTASKSPCADYNIMQNRRSIALPNNDVEADAIEQKVFNGSVDIVSRAGEPAKVVKQEWDQKTWFANSGGSHRSSALWVYDNQNNIDRPIDCTVEEIQVHDEFKDFSAHHDMWIFQVTDIESFLELQQLMFNDRYKKDVVGGLNFSLLRGGHTDGNYHYSLTLPHHSPLRSKIKTLMDNYGAFNLSNWAKAPQSYSFTDKHFLIAPG